MTIDCPNSNRGVRAITIKDEKNMRNYEEQKVEQLDFLGLKEGTKKKVPAKRVDIVSLKVIRERSILYKDRQVRSPQDSYDIIRTFLEDSDREMFIAMSLDVKNQPTNIQICHIGSSYRCRSGTSAGVCP